MIIEWYIVIYHYVHNQQHVISWSNGNLRLISDQERFTVRDDRRWRKIHTKSAGYLLGNQNSHWSCGIGGGFVAFGISHWLNGALHHFFGEAQAERIATEGFQSSSARSRVPKCFRANCVLRQCVAWIHAIAAVLALAWYFVAIDQHFSQQLCRNSLLGFQKKHPKHNMSAETWELNLNLKCLRFHWALSLEWLNLRVRCTSEISWPGFSWRQPTDRGATEGLDVSGAPNLGLALAEGFLVELGCWWIHGVDSRGACS